MRAKLRHLSWKRNFVLALFEEGAFFLSGSFILDIRRTRSYYLVGMIVDSIHSCF